MFEEDRRYLQVLRWGQVVLWVPWGPEGKKTDRRHNISVTTYNQFKLHKQRTAILHIVLFFLGDLGRNPTLGSCPLEFHQKL